MWDDGEIWKGAQQGELRLRTCNACQHICHPPLPVCPHCQASRWTLRAASGTARVKDWLLSTHPSRPEMPPRLVVVVELAEGVRVVSELIDADIADVREDMPVQLCFATVDGIIVPQFRPLAASALR